MCVLDPRHKNNLSGLPLVYVLPMVALQAWFLQGVILLYMALQLKPRDDVDQQKELPEVMVFVAIYLHFINCVTEWPMALSLVRVLHHLHQDVYGLTVFTFIFIGDAFIVPFFSLTIGGLYLCTS